jgi:hypothetical protein
VGGQQNAVARANVVKTAFRGTEISYTAEQIHDIVRVELSAHERQSDQSYWHVQVDSRRIGVKKLASLLTGVPVAQFHTDVAKRLLTKLGMTVIGS